MKKTLQNSMRESISSINRASRNALHGFIFTNDSATVAYFQEHETGNIHKLKPDTPITAISNSDEELTHIETTGKDVLETLTLDEQVAYAGADAFLAMSEAEVLLDDAEVERPNHNRLTCELNITTFGNVFLAEMKMMAFDELFHVSTSQAKTKEELKDDFRYFKSGFLKFLKLVSASDTSSFIPIEDRITLKELRVMSGVHHYILAERMGISIEYLKRLEKGIAKRSPKYDQAFIHFQSTCIKGMKLDWMDWSLEQQKSPTRHCNDD